MNKIFKNFLSIFAGNILGKCLTFIFSLFVARFFGKAIFGMINFSNSIVTYFLMISSMGLQTYGILQISKNNDKNENRQSIFNEIFSNQLILSFIAFSLLCIFLYFVNDINMQNKKMILAYGGCIFANAFNINWYYNATQNMQYISYNIIFKNLISLLILIFFSIYDKENIFIIPFSLVIGTVITNLFFIEKIKKQIDIKFAFKIKNLIKIIKLSFPFFFSGIFATINCNIDTVFLGFMTNNESVGLYNASYKIINILLSVCAIVFTPVYPVMIELFSKQKDEKLTQLLNKLRKFMYIISLPIIFGSMVFSRDIILFLYGKQYIGAITSLKILLIYVSLLYIRECYGYRLNACGLQKKYMKITFLSATINIILNIITIPRLGINGAAISTLISEFINIIFMYKVAQNFKKVQINNNFLIRTICSSLIMLFEGIALKKFNINSVISILICILSYFVLILTLKAITIKELKLLIRR